MTSGSPKPQRSTKNIFVIMPFTASPTRNAQQLNSFYEERIKKPIEAGRFQNRYLVGRSDETFNINEQIIKDLYAADIVIADLSGVVPNPNVMYELGMRLAFSNGPVILIREQNPGNKTVFDVSGFYAETYDPMDPGSVSTYLRTKIKRFETGKEQYRSPVLTVLGQEFPLLMTISRRRAAELLAVLHESLMGTLRLFTGAATDFIHEHSKVRLGTNANEFTRETVEHFSALKKLQWENFSFMPGSQPAVDYYISSPYLQGIVKDEIQRRFTEMVIEYHAHFLAGDAFWRPLSLEAVSIFAGETRILSGLCLILMAILQATEQDVIKKSGTDFEKLCTSSYWQPKQNSNPSAGNGGARREGESGPQSAA